MDVLLFRSKFIRVGHIAFVQWTDGQDFLHPLDFDNGGISDWKPPN